MEEIEKVNLLLVDDREDNLTTLEAVLQSPTYHLVKARSGEEALAILEVTDFALVLMDVQMPGLDGYQTAQRIKSNERTKNIPIIFITAIFKEEPQIRRGYEVGGIDYFGKPFDPHVLIKKVDIYTQIFQQNAKMQQRERLLKLRNEELEHHSAELSTVLESVPEAIYIGKDNRIRKSNAAALTLFGFERSEDMVQDFSDFADKLTMRDANSGARISVEELPSYKALKGETSSRKIVVRNVKTGKDLIVNCISNPIYYKDEIIGAVIVNLPEVISHSVPILKNP